MNHQVKLEFPNIDHPGSIYVKLGKYYDLMYDNYIDYKNGSDILEIIFSKFNGENRGFNQKKIKTILDLGCGTGNYTIELSRRGYRVTGVDFSRMCIKAAVEKLKAEPELEMKPDFILQDIRCMEIKKKFDASLALFGVMSYITEIKSLTETLSRIRSALVSGGLFIGEIWQFSGVKDNFSSISTGKSEKSQLILERLTRWKIKEGSEIINVGFDFKLKDMKTGKVIDEFSEYHKIRAFQLEEFELLLNNAGFDLIGYYNADGNLAEFKPPGEKTLRTFFISQSI